MWLDMYLPHLLAAWYSFAGMVRNLLVFIAVLWFWLDSSSVKSSLPTPVNKNSRGGIPKGLEKSKKNPVQGEPGRDGMCGMLSSSQKKMPGGDISAFSRCKRNLSGYVIAVLRSSQDDSNLTTRSNPVTSIFVINKHITHRRKPSTKNDKQHKHFKSTNIAIVCVLIDLCVVLA